MVVDLDRFGAINDALGHELGDELLRLVGRRLQECLRPGDVVARVAGDEFGLALANLTRAEDVSLIARKVNDAFKHPFTLGPRDVYLSGSVGITVYPDDGDDIETLLKNANTAMARAKEERRNTYEYYVPAMNQHAADLLRLETDLRAALERGDLDAQFSLHYQPKISAATDRWTGLEALLRWYHPSEGAVPPSCFVPLLEQTGLIVEVGDWVLERAARDYCAWKEAGLNPPPIAVNVSLLQLRDIDFVASVRNVLAHTGMAPGALHLEITESVIMQNIEEIASKLRELKLMGLSISVDDFGTGYSSLAYLATLPLDELKIDRVFIAKMLSSVENRTLVAAIVSLAHSLRLRVVAEGVEKEAQTQALRELKCDELQGFLLGKPMPGEKIAKLLKPRNARARRAK
jgi:diguanylate cyclase (GGDEF)-like protein